MTTLSHPYRPTPSLLAICVLLLSGHAAAQAPSKGVYRIPYADGTDIKVTNDHIKHDPPGRIDMSGKGGGPYKIVAAADGVVRHVVDGFDKRISGCKDLAASEKKNNYVWIEHPNGEWTKYTHMIKGSSSGKAKLKVGQSVTAGTYLGDEGDVGCASGDHLHFEVGVPKASDGISTVGGFLTDNDGSKRNRIPRICGISSDHFVSGQSYQARKVPGNLKPGSKEVARHGVPARDYQCLFDQAVNAGYALEWIDGFDVGGNVYYNAVFRPKNTTGWTAFHGLTGAQYQQRFNEYTGKGYRPHQVESYQGQGGVRYAVIFRKQSGPAYSAYHGLDANAHQAKMDALSKDGYRPRNVSVVSSGGKARHGLTSSQYQSEWQTNTGAGLLTRDVTGYSSGGSARYAGIWRK